MQSPTVTENTVSWWTKKRALWWWWGWESGRPGQKGPGRRLSFIPRLMVVQWWVFKQRLIRSPCFRKIAPAAAWRIRGNKTVQGHLGGHCRHLGRAGVSRSRGWRWGWTERLTPKRNLEGRTSELLTAWRGRRGSGMITHHERRREGGAQVRGSDTEIWGT